MTPWEGARGCSHRVQGRGLVKVWRATRHTPPSLAAAAPQYDTRRMSLRPSPAAPCALQHLHTGVLPAVARAPSHLVLRSHRDERAHGRPGRLAALRHRLACGQGQDAQQQRRTHARCQACCRGLGLMPRSQAGRGWAHGRRPRYGHARRLRGRRSAPCRSPGAAPKPASCFPLGVEHATPTPPLTLRNCPPWLKPTALYPPASSVRLRSCAHASATWWPWRGESGRQEERQRGSRVGEPCRGRRAGEQAPRARGCRAGPRPGAVRWRQVTAGEPLKQLPRLAAASIWGLAWSFTSPK
jgi:hypothetical protein